MILGVFPGIPPEENQVVPMGWSRAMRSSEVLKSVHCILVSFTNAHAPSFHLSNCTHALQSLFKINSYYISSKIFLQRIWSWEDSWWFAAPRNSPAERRRMEKVWYNPKVERLNIKQDWNTLWHISWKYDLTNLEEKVSNPHWAWQIQ